jgi:anti-anti-sigma factor
MMRIEQINGCYVVTFNDISKFNALITDMVKEQLNSLFSKPDVKLILNLKGVKYIDSTGFGVFLSVMKTARLSKGEFKICGIENDAMVLFKILQLNNVFEIYDNLEVCLNSFTNK